MVKKVTKRVRIGGLTDVPSSLREELKTQIAETIIEEIYDSVEGGVSPVSGKAFKSLKKGKKGKKSYAEREKGGDYTPNLFLTGDMLSSLTFETYRDGVEIGIFDDEEAQKADNHNKFSAKSMKTKVPKRQFIPKSDEIWTKKIMERVNRTVKEFVKDNDLE